VRFLILNATMSFKIYKYNFYKGKKEAVWYIKILSTGKRMAFSEKFYGKQLLEETIDLFAMEVCDAPNNYFFNLNKFQRKAVLKGLLSETRVHFVFPEMSELVEEAFPLLSECLPCAHFVRDDCRLSDAFIL
jgi:hypothetical protein